MSQFDTRAKDWDKNLTLHELAKVVSALIQQQLPAGKALSGLEIGSGTGTLGLELAPVFQQITFSDASAQMLVFLRDKVCRAHISDKTTIMQNDIEKAELSETYDCIFSQMMLHHIQNHIALCAKLKKALNPGGILCFADAHLEDGSFHGENIVPHNGFDPAQLAKELEACGLKPLVYENIFTIEKNNKQFPIFLIIAKV